MCHTMMNLKVQRFEGISIWLIRLELCAGETGTTIDVEELFCNERKTERGTAKVFGKRKEKSRKSSSVYIVDIQVMIVFFADHTM